MVTKLPWKLDLALWTMLTKDFWSKLPLTSIEDCVATGEAVKHPAGCFIGGLPFWAFLIRKSKISHQRSDGVMDHRAGQPLAFILRTFPRSLLHLITAAVICLRLGPRNLQPVCGALYYAENIGSWKFLSPLQLVGSLILNWSPNFFIAHHSSIRLARTASRSERGGSISCGCAWELVGRLFKLACGARTLWNRYVSSLPGSVPHWRSFWRIVISNHLFSVGRFHVLAGASRRANHVGVARTVTGWTIIFGDPRLHAFRLEPLLVFMCESVALQFFGCEIPGYVPEHLVWG